MLENDLSLNKQYFQSDVGCNRNNDRKNESVSYLALLPIIQYSANQEVDQRNWNPYQPIA